MAWIKTIPREIARGELRDAYERLYGLFPKEYSGSVPSLVGPDGKSESIVAAHSLLPEVMEPIFRAFSHLVSENISLSRREQELIHTLVSALNRCHYWTESHAEFLRRVTLDESLSDEISRDYTKARISERERIILDYVAKLNETPAQVTKEDIQKLRAAGFDDRGILQINLCTALFNYFNRVADGLGVGR